MITPAPPASQLLHFQVIDPLFYSIFWTPGHHSNMCMCVHAWVCVFPHTKKQFMDTSRLSENSTQFRQQQLSTLRQQQIPQVKGSAPRRSSSALETHLKPTLLPVLLTHQLPGGFNNPIQLSMPTTTSSCYLHLWWTGYKSGVPWAQFSC